jgi:hypothetical protein
MKKTYLETLDSNSNSNKNSHSIVKRSDSLSWRTQSTEKEQNYSKNIMRYDSFNSVRNDNFIPDPRNEFLSAVPKKFFKDHTEKPERYNATYSAGILPFYTKNKTIYFLLGKDGYSNTWSDFGGRADQSDNERWDVTAAREFFEETIGSVADITTMIAKLQIKKNYIKIKDKTLNNSVYHMYVLKIPYKEIYRHNFLSTLSFLKYIKGEGKVDANGKSSSEYKQYLEKIDMQWVSLDTIKNSMSGSEESIEYPLRSIFKRTLERNYDRIVEFCNLFHDKNYNYLNENIL